MADPKRIATWLLEPGLSDDIDAAVQAAEEDLRADLRIAARRRVVRDDLDLEWDGVTLRSLWLVAHRGLRRAGVRAHPASTALLVSWRGAGLVALREPGSRATIAPVPWDALPNVDGARHVCVPAGQAYDTLADARAWHVLAFHSHAAKGLVRRQAVVQDMIESWVDRAEEEPS